MHFLITNYYSEYSLLIRTYKITTPRCPLSIYGLSDIHGQFHSISFIITSYEREEDFYYFFNCSIKQAELLGLEFNPDFIMQGACRASLNAIKSFFTYA